MAPEFVEDVDLRAGFRRDAELAWAHPRESWRELADKPVEPVDENQGAVVRAGNPGGLVEPRRECRC